MKKEKGERKAGEKQEKLLHWESRSSTKEIGTAGVETSIVR